MLQTYERHGKAKLVATIISVIVVAGIVMVVDHLKAQQAATSATTTANTSTTTGSSGGSSSNQSAGFGSSGSSTGSSFNDGTYTASNDYLVPDGSESINVSLTLKGGTITDASVQNSEGDPTSAFFQQNFASAIKSQVVGKKISSLQLSVVAGASDTTRGFENALGQIASKAQG